MRVQSLESESMWKLDVLSAKAERGLPPVNVCERDREREIFTDFHQYSHDCKHAYKALVSPEKYLGYRCHFYFFLSVLVIQR